MTEIQNSKRTITNIVSWKTTTLKAISARFRRKSLRPVLPKVTQLFKHIDSWLEVWSCTNTITQKMTIRGNGRIGEGESK